MAIHEASSQRTEFEQHFRQWTQRGADPSAVVALYPMLTGSVTQQMRAEKWLSDHLGLGDPSNPDNQVRLRSDLLDARNLRYSTGLAPTPGEIMRDFDPDEKRINAALDQHSVPVQSAKFADTSRKPLSEAEHDEMAYQRADYATLQDQKFSRRRPGENMEFSYLPGMRDEDY